MPHEFDPGYPSEPFRSLCRNYPDQAVYPPQDFRVEWGPIFHRGRLDGTARVLVLGQDPATHEAVSRRILVGEAGQRIQGFLFKLGIDRSYVMINCFLYSVFGQQGGNKHKNDSAIARYRHRWLNALLANGKVEVVVALGTLAGQAWEQWRKTAAGKKFRGAFAKIIHPTFPESAAASGTSKLKDNVKLLLADWNTALAALHPAVTTPDKARALVPYGEAFAADDLKEIPECDLPAGLPAWMRGLKAWASRTGTTPEQKRATLTVKVPSQAMP